LGRRRGQPDSAASNHNSLTDAVADLGKPEEIGKVFSGFQKYLYDTAA